MPFVKQVDDRHHLHSIAVTIGGINIVIQGDKADIMKWENIIYILTYFDIITSKPTQILTDDEVNSACLCIGKQSLHRRSVEVRPTETVINVCINEVPALLTDIFCEDKFLMFNRQGFACTHILLRETNVNSCVVNGLLCHSNSFQTKQPNSTLLL